MSGRTHDPAGTRFEVPSQVGSSIANVGGNLYVGGERGRVVSIGRAVSALGLALFFGGLFLLGLAGAAVYRDTDWTADVIDPVVPGYAVPAAALVVIGIVLNRFGRLFAGR
jgi:PQQ-like domain